jgi:hypothetical protein
MLLLPQAAVGAPPANDNFADAAELSGLPLEWTGSNVEATRETDEPDHLNPGSSFPTGDHSIWFRWTAPRDGGVTLVSYGCGPPFQDSAGSSLAIAVYAKSDVFGFVRVGAGGAPFRAAAGRVYWFAVESSLPNSPQAVPLPDPDICLRLLPAPSNDDFARAAPLRGFPVSVVETAPTDRTTSEEGSATIEPGEPFHGGERGGSSIWYRWTAPFNGPVVLRLCGSGTLAAYTGNRLAALTHVATRRPRERICGSQPGASVVIDAVRGEVFRIALASLTTSDTSVAFQLMIGNQVAVVTWPGRAPFFS